MDVGSKTLLPTLVAFGGGLAALPLAALELGEANVNSSLGQPLRASIAYALAPNESLTSSCVTLQGARSTGGLPSVGRASISIANGMILVSGDTPIREPLVTMQINIRCPYTPRLSREYMLFVDPVQVTRSPAVATISTVAPVATATPVTTVAPAPAARRVVSQEPIGNATRYQVQLHENLSEIAQRVEFRPPGLGLWDVVAIIFDANPDAFMDNNPNRLKAGSWLNMPDFDSADSVAFANRNAFSRLPVTISTATNTANVDTMAASSAYPGIAVDIQAPDPMIARPTDNTFIAEPGSDTIVTVTGDSEASSAGPGLHPGDIILDSDSRFVTTDDATVVIPDTTLVGPETTSSSPNVPTAIIQPPATASTVNWLLWLAGSGVAIFAGLLLFGSRLRSQFGSTPIGAAAIPQPRQKDEDTQNLETLGEFDMDEILTADNLTLDADLVIGTGLQQGTDIDVAQDFGFAATTAIDIELPEERPDVLEDMQTDIIPPMFFETGAILDSEVMGDEDKGTGDEDDYDMSVIVDATKMPNLDDVTKRDLEAVPVNIDEGQFTGDYTLTEQADFEALEQDYEDEFTATQALNVEIEKAAQALVNDRDNADTKESSDNPLASVTSLDVTSKLPTKTVEISDLDDTGVNEAVTVNMSENEETAEMPVDDLEATADFELESGKSG